MPEANLATKLHVFLEQMQKFERSNGNSALEVMPRFLASLTPAEDLDQGQLLQRMARVNAAPQRIAIAIQDRLGVDRYVKPLSYLQRARDMFTIPSLGTPWSSVLQRIDDAMLLAFDSMAEVLRDLGMFKYGEAQASSTQRARTAVVDMLDDLRAEPAGVDKPLYDLLVFHLQSMLDAIDMSPWIGSHDLERAYHEALGAVVDKSMLRGMSPDAVKTRNAVGRFLRVLGFVADAVGVLSFALALGAGGDIEINNYVYNTIVIESDSTPPAIEGPASAVDSDTAGAASPPPDR